MYDRSVAGDRCSGKQISAGWQWYLNALISGGGRSAYQMVFGSNPADRFGCGDRKDADLLFAQETSPSGHFVRQRKLRILAQEAALGEVANSKSRGALA